MPAKNFKVVFELDEADAVYFRNLYRKARRNSARLDPTEVIAEARALVRRVNGSKKVPHFVVRSIEPLMELTNLLEDKDYVVPKAVHTEAIAALAYFADPEDLIPDHIPVLGFLDDAIMVRFLEEQFEAELWAYRRFCAYRERAEQRPWTSVARQRLPERMERERKKLRGQIEVRKKKRSGFLGLGW